MPTTFRAAVVRTPGGPDSIEIIDVPVVEAGPGQVRVEIAGAAVNPVDLALAAGVFHERGLVDQPAHTGLGWDFAGTVTAVGPDVDLPVGSRVAGLVDGFDRDFGTYAEQLVVPASHTALVPDGLDLATAATVPLNGLAAAQLVDLLGDGGGRSLLVTGAAGAVGGYVVPLAQDRGWRVTGLARPEDEKFVRGLGADFTADAAPGWDAVADGAVLQEQGMALVREGGIFVGMLPGAGPAEERDITVRVVVAKPDGARLAQLLDATASGHLPARVHAVVPLDEAAAAHRRSRRAACAGGSSLCPESAVRDLVRPGRQQLVRRIRVPALQRRIDSQERASPRWGATKAHMSREGPFWDVMEGRAEPPPAAVLLGWELLSVDPDEGTIEVAFTATEQFLNPVGVVQGGLLAAMLDDTLGPALVATLGPGEFAPTTNLQVQFLRPARPGRLVGRGRIVRRASGVGFLAGELVDESGDVVATATATAVVRSTRS